MSGIEELVGCQPRFFVAMTSSSQSHILKGHSNHVNSVCFSGDSQSLASASSDRTLRLWDVATGHASIFQGHVENALCVCFNANGKIIVSGGADNTVRVWDAGSQTLKAVFHGHSDNVRAVSFSGDGQTIASASWDNTVRVWDAITGRELHVLNGHTDHVLAVCFSRNDKTIASGSRDRTVRVWDATTGHELLVFRGHTGPVESVSFSGDGRTIASASLDKTVRVWDSVTGEVQAVLRGHTARVTSVCWSEDDRHVASGSDDKTVRVWDVTSGSEQLVLRHTAEVRSVSWSKGSMIASGSKGGTVRLWDVAKETFDQDKMAQNVEGTLGKSQDSNENDARIQASDDSLSGPLKHVSAGDVSLEQIEGALQAVKGGKAPYNSVTCISIGPGRTGKTSTRRSLQGHAFKATQSTVGGERADMMQLKKGDMVEMKELEGQSHMILDHVVATQMHGSTPVPEAGNALTVAGDVMQQKTDAVAQLDAHGQMMKVSVRECSQGSGKPLSVLSRLKPNIDKSREAAQVTQGAGVHEDPGIALSQASSTVDKISVQRQGDMQLLTERLKDAGKKETGIHISFFDMGGQPEFWPLVVSYLRDHSIFSIFFRMDEVLAEINSASSDLPKRTYSRLTALQELHVWLNAVPASTTYGPVMLVGTYGDVVQDENDRKKISDHIYCEMKRKQHPLVQQDQDKYTRLQRPACGLWFFPVDNTQSDNDPGIKSYRSKMQELCEVSPTVRSAVPLSLLTLQDSLVSLTRDAADDESDVCTRLRAEYGGDRGHVSHIRMDDFVSLYNEHSDDASDKGKRLYLEFLHMKGIVMHNNKPSLADLVIVDPVWLLETVTTIICRPDLHGDETASHLGEDEFNMLYKQGLLAPYLVEQFWPKLQPKLREQVLNLMIQLGLIVAMDSRESASAVYLIPALLPEDPSEVHPGLEEGDDVQDVICVFYMGHDLFPPTLCTKPVSDVEKRCSMPAGLFEQVSGKLLELCQSSGSNGYDYMLSRRYSLLALGNFEIELKREQSMHGIRMTLHADSRERQAGWAARLLQQIGDVVRNVLEAHFLSLKFEFVIEDEANHQFVQLSEILRNWSLQQGMRLSRRREDNLRLEDLEARFSALLPQPPAEGMYHVFVSYRTGQRKDVALSDSEAARSLANNLTGHVTVKNTATSVFYDLQSLKQGEQFDVEFMRNMSKSLIVTPIVTKHALERMRDCCHVDHVLLEWWLAYTLYTHRELECVYRIVPVFCGEETLGSDGKPKITKLFDDQAALVSQLPREVNEPTYKVLKSFVAEQYPLKGVEPPRLTVAALVETIFKFNSSVNTWDEFNKRTEARDWDDATAAADVRLELTRVYSNCAKAIRLTLDQLLTHVDAAM